MYSASDGKPPPPRPVQRSLLSEERDMLGNFDGDALIAGYFVGLVCGSLLTSYFFRLARCENCCQK